MNHKLLGKFVLNGMEKNKKTLVPFLIAGTMTVMFFYIMQSLAYCPYIYKDKIEAFYGAQIISIILEISSRIVAIFAVIFLFYANQFMIKERKKEMGLYGVLGMSKKNITWILTAESLIHAGICIIGGIALGTFLNKLMLLILYKIIGQPPVNGLFFSGTALKNTVILFVIIFAVCLIYNVSTIRVGNPITLLQSDRTGEKEPKVKIFTFLIGIVTLIAGYGLALSSKSAIDAIGKLFLSILLVVIATYCLFTAGSIFILKRLKKNPKFYYKTKNFISVSNLMFRMKHNAAGLASICLLSTGVILLLTCGFSLMMLGEENLNDRYPTDIKIEMSAADKKQGTEAYEEICNSIQKAGISTSGQVYREYKNMVLLKDGEKQEITSSDSIYSNMSDCLDVYFMTQDDYNEYAGTDWQLTEDEVLIYSSAKKWAKGDILNFAGKAYTVAGDVDYKKSYYIIDPTMSLFEHEILVFADEAQINAFMEKNILIENPDDYNVYIGFQTRQDLTQEQMEQIKQVAQMSGKNLEVMFKSEDKVLFYSLYGGTFFVGVFLAVLFLMATVMIIYYKQMSEGYEDQKRFHILANVGLTEKEAKKSIQTQVMLLFFLPVGAAIVHMIVASKVVRLFLHMILIVDAFTFNLAIAVVCVIFLAVYALVYKVTSKEYYKIVNAG